MTGEHPSTTPKDDPKDATAISTTAADTSAQTDTDDEEENLYYTVTVPLKLKKRHHSRLQEILDLCRRVYNAANEERHGVRNRFLRHEWVLLKKRETAKTEAGSPPGTQPERVQPAEAAHCHQSGRPDVKNLSVAVVRGALKALAAAWKNVGKPIPNSGGRSVRVFCVGMGGAQQFSS